MPSLSTPMTMNPPCAFVNAQAVSMHSVLNDSFSSSRCISCLRTMVSSSSLVMSNLLVSRGIVYHFSLPSHPLPGLLRPFADFCRLLPRRPARCGRASVHTGHSGSGRACRGRMESRHLGGALGQRASRPLRTASHRFPHPSILPSTSYIAICDVPRSQKSRTGARHF